jgi:hypothetical protein
MIVFFPYVFLVIENFFSENKKKTKIILPFSVRNILINYYAMCFRTERGSAVRVLGSY